MSKNLEKRKGSKTESKVKIITKQKKNQNYPLTGRFIFPDFHEKL